jgi:hypothetical protein
MHGGDSLLESSTEASRREAVLGLNFFAPDHLAGLNIPFPGTELGGTLRKPKPFLRAAQFDFSATPGSDFLRQLVNAPAKTEKTGISCISREKAQENQPRLLPQSGSRTAAWDLLPSHSP